MHKACSTWRICHVRPASIVLVLRPKEILRLISDGIEILGDIEVEFQWIGNKRSLDLFLPIEGPGGISSHVKRLGGKLGRFSGALNRKKNLVEKAQYCGIEVLLVGLLLALQVFALGMALWNSAISFLRGEKLTSCLFDAAHCRFFAGENAQIILLAQSIEEPLNLLWGDLRIRGDDQQHPPLSDTVSYLI